MELIDKADVVAEIERLKHKLLDLIICESDKEWAIRTAHQLNRIIWFINTLEVKEVDLVEEIVERCKKSWYNEGKIAGMAEGLTDDEKYQQGWHDAVEKACEWLYQRQAVDLEVSDIDKFVNEFKKAMED